jgi:hypothetical protein
MARRARWVECALCIGGMRNTNFYSENLKGIDYWGNMGVCGKIIDL